MALPAIGADLDAGIGGLQWILNAYTLALAALIPLGGSLADHFRRHRVGHSAARWTVCKAIVRKNAARAPSDLVGSE
jgi:MFS family permease